MDARRRELGLDAEFYMECGRCGQMSWMFTAEEFILAVDALWDAIEPNDKERAKRSSKKPLKLKVVISVL